MHTGFFNGRGRTSRLGLNAAIGPKVTTLKNKTKNSSDLDHHFLGGPLFFIIHLFSLLIFLFCASYGEHGPTCPIPCMRPWVEGAGRLLAKTERSQWLQAETEDIGRLHAVTERNRLIQVETGKFGCSKTVRERVLRLLARKEGCQRLGKG